MTKADLIHELYLRGQRPRFAPRPLTRRETDQRVAEAMAAVRRPSRLSLTRESRRAEDDAIDRLVARARADAARRRVMAPTPARRAGETRGVPLSPDEEREVRAALASRRGGRCHTPGAEATR